MGIYQGIDIGSKNVRRVTIKSEWNSVKTVEGLKPGKKILSVPSNLLTFRQFRFPFQDKRRILEILPGELMDTLAFPIDSVQWDISSIEKDRVNTFIIPKKHLENFNISSGNSVNIIDAEPCALARVASFNKLENVLVIDFGASKTSFYGINNGKLEIVRTRPIGGNYIDSTLAVEMQISLEDAEVVKAEKGLENHTSKRIVESLIQSAAIPHPSPFEKIIITGGGGMLPGLREYIASKYETPVDVFDLPENLSPFFDAVAFGTALYDSHGREKINLKEQQKTSHQKTYYWIAALLLIPLILFSLTLHFKLSNLRSEQIKLHNAMTEAVRKQFPDIGPIRAPVRQVEAMVRKNGSQKSGKGMDILEILSNFANARNEVNVSFYEMDIVDTTARIKGEADSFQAVDDLSKAMKKYFSGVEVVDQKTKPNGKVDFNLKIDTVRIDSSKSNSTKKGDEN
jgi:cell division ATPase FtsA